MTWGSPPKFTSTARKQGAKLTPEQLAKTGSEDGNQMALFCWAANNCGQYPQLKWLFAIPNGGSRHIAEATNMVAMGLRSGVWDVCLPFASGGKDAWHSGCFIEMKTEKRRNNKDGGLEEEQIEFMNAVTPSFYCKVCYSWIEARDTLIAYLEGKL